MIIAIDGPAASGKGTLARRLAAHFGLTYLDTGALYRAVGHAVLASGADPHDKAAAVAAARSVDPTSLDDPALRTPETGRAASIVAAMPAVREALLDYQRTVAATPPGAVLDGRDIGTVICPTADVKLFVTAGMSARAERRYLELAASGADTDRKTVLRDLLERDSRDSERDSAPLRPAADAHLLDTSNLDIEAAFRAALSIVEGALDA
jgi:cytidylate kinase